jgi:NADPH:quinone reductase-like Zn-dependent oxidoreductase
MQAIVYTHYGSPDVLRLQEVEKPTPQDNQVLVKVYAASANPLDWHRMRGAPFLARLGGGLRKPEDPRLGADVAGQFEAVGSSVTQFQPGDEVFGCVTGAFAEYVCAPETDFALKPTNLSFEQAAAVPVVAFTALQGLRDTGHIQAGQTVLIIWCIWWGRDVCRPACQIVRRSRHGRMQHAESRSRARDWGRPRD